MGGVYRAISTMALTSADPHNVASASRDRSNSWGRSLVFIFLLARSRDAGCRSTHIYSDVFGLGVLRFPADYP